MTWAGVTARYTEREKAIMRRLRKAGASQAELRFIHEAKARFDGRLR